MSIEKVTLDQSDIDLLELGSDDFFDISEVLSAAPTDSEISQARLRILRLSEEGLVQVFCAEWPDWDDPVVAQPAEIAGLLNDAEAWKDPSIRRTKSDVIVLTTAKGKALLSAK